VSQGNWNSRGFVSVGMTDIPYTLQGGAVKGFQKHRNQNVKLVRRVYIMSEDSGSLLVGAVVGMTITSKPKGDEHQEHLIC